MDELKKETKKKASKKGKEFIVLSSKNIGSNKDGTPKEVYVKGTTIRLSDNKKIESLKSLKII